MKGPGQGLESFDCQLKRAICTQEEKGQPIPAPMNATGCQCQSWLVWASMTVGIKRGLRLLWLGSRTASQDHKDWAVGHQLRLTVVLLQLPGQCQQKATYGAESFTKGCFCLWSVNPTPVHGSRFFSVLQWAARNNRPLPLSGAGHAQTKENKSKRMVQHS